MSTRTRLFILALVSVPLAAHANPYVLDARSAIAFSVVAFWALVIESGIVTLMLVPCGVLILPAFVCLGATNIAVFLFVFMPLSGHVSVWILEIGVVIADALLIKLVSAIPLLQGGGFVGVGWLRALIASLIGNTASFFVGVIAAGAPWIDRSGTGTD